MKKSQLLALLLLAMPYVMTHTSEELRAETSASSISSSLQKCRKNNTEITTTAIEMLNVINRNEILCKNHHPCLNYCFWSCCMSRSQNRLREMITFNTDLDSKIDTLLKANTISRD